MPLPAKASAGLLQTIGHAVLEMGINLERFLKAYGSMEVLAAKQSTSAFTRSVGAEPIISMEELGTYMGCDNSVAQMYLQYVLSPGSNGGFRDSQMKELEDMGVFKLDGISAAGPHRLWLDEVVAPQYLDSAITGGSE